MWVLESRTHSSVLEHLTKKIEVFLDYKLLEVRDQILFIPLSSVSTKGFGRQKHCVR